MRGTGVWLQAALLLGAAQGAVARAPAAIDLPGDRFFPESVTSDGKGHAYVPSAQGGIYRVTLASGKIEQWIAPGAFGSASIFGVLVDPARRMLWACSNDLTAFGITVTGADKGSKVKGFDLRNGKGKVSLALPGGTEALCNDLTLAKDGTLYVSDSNRSHILRWQPGKALADWYFNPALADPAHANSGLDGIVMTPDGSLLVNNFRLNKLARIAIRPDGAPGAMTVIATSRPLEVPDGMRQVAGDRYAVAEGSGKIAIVTLDGDKAEVRTIAEGLPSAAGVTIEGNIVWHVPGELSYVFNPQKRTQTPPLPFRLSPAPLP